MLTVKTEETAIRLRNVWSMRQIDVLEVEGKFYGFSGCHRYEVRRLLKYRTSSKSVHDPVHGS